MWSLRLAIRSLKTHCSWLGASRVISAKSGIISNFLGNGIGGMCTLEILISGGCASLKELQHTPSFGERFFVGSCGYCSQAGARNDNEDDEEEGDSEELLSELESSDNNENGVSSEGSKEKRAVALELLNAILESPNYDISDVLDKWDERGNELSQEDISIVMVGLRKRRRYGKALQLSEWLETSKRIDVMEEHYASRLKLVANAQGLFRAEKFVEKIPESFRGELVYRGLLECCVRALNLNKAEAVFKKMKDLELPITADVGNQMIILYKKLDKKRIADILSTMEKQNIKPSLLTYKLLLDVKGESNDIMGMEQLFEAMTGQGIEPDIGALFVMAKHYVSRGFKEKAESIVKQIEERKQKESFGARRALLMLYASLGKADEVCKIWKDCESDPKLKECVTAMEAWGKLGKVEEAEAVFKLMLQRWKVSSKHYSSLLNIYVQNKLVSKGKDIVKQMSDSGQWIGPLAWDALVRLYIEAGDVEKADSILQKAAQYKRTRPLFKTYLTVMDQYAKQGDIRNTEKLFHRMKEVGYTRRLKPYEVLFLAYDNAKTPAYGFRERMKADYIFPNRDFARKLALADPFKESAVSDLLD